MKVSLIFLVAIGLSYGAVLPYSKQERDIHDDIEDFIALIPVDKILPIVLDYLANDAEVQDAVAYLQSAEFKSNVQTVENQSVTKELLDFLEGTGLHAYDTVNSINDLLELPHINQRRAHHNRSIRKLIDEILAVLPLDEIKALYNKKMASSPEFSNLIQQLSSQEFHVIVNHFREIPEEQNVEQKLGEYGIDVDEIIQIIHDFFGWK